MNEIEISGKDHDENIARYLYLDFDESTDQSGDYYGQDDIDCGDFGKWNESWPPVVRGGEIMITIDDEDEDQDENEDDDYYSDDEECSESCKKKFTVICLQSLIVAIVIIALSILQHLVESGIIKIF